MKKIVALLLFPLMLSAQDTIRNRDGNSINCKILEVSQSAIRYKPVKGADKIISIGNVSEYFYKGNKQTIVPAYSFDQETGRITFVRVLTFDQNLSSDKIYAFAKDWLTKQSFKPITENKEINKLAGNKEERFSFSPDIMTNLHYNYDLRISVKENRARIELSNINYHNYGPDHLKLVKLESCDREGKLEDLLKCEDLPLATGKLYEHIYINSQDAFTSFEKHVRKSSSKADGW